MNAIKMNLYKPGLLHNVVWQNEGRSEGGDYLCESEILLVAIIAVAKYCVAVQIEEDELGWDCSTRIGDEV